MYEICIELYTMLVQAYNRTKEYNQLMHNLNNCNLSTVSLLKAVCISPPSLSFLPIFPTLPFLPLPFSAVVLPLYSTFLKKDRSFPSPLCLPQTFTKQKTDEQNKMNRTGIREYLPRTSEWYSTGNYMTLSNRTGRNLFTASVPVRIWWLSKITSNG